MVIGNWLLGIIVKSLNVFTEDIRPRPDSPGSGYLVTGSQQLKQAIAELEDQRSIHDDEVVRGIEPLSLVGQTERPIH